ncbi:IS3 family transposase [Myceligenerans salitolerans]|uniref:IS3 family transposase n=1 Tax=Myceligenerans salitolerans TaxID=1230528 RepID=UPI00355655F3
MVRKFYPEEFKADAVELYSSTPGATIKEIAADLGVHEGTLSRWLQAAGVTSPTAAGRADDGGGSSGAGVPETAAEELERLRAEVKRLRADKSLLETEREILRKAAKYFAGRDDLVSRFQFVAEFHDTYGVKRLCEVLQIGRSSYYKWRDGADRRAERVAADADLAAKASAITAQFDGTYGSPRVTAELRDAGVVVNAKRVARVMREHGVVGVHLRKKVRTTVPAKDAPKVPDLLERDFTADAPNRKYVGDITYLPIGDGQFLYLATVIDCFNRRLVGWQIADHMRDTLVIEALDAAARERGSLAGAIFHSDNGRQYCSDDFLAAAGRHGLTLSRGAVGTSADNALAESFNAALKRETLQGERRWNGARECRKSVFRWVTRYNTRRRHSYCDYMSPIDFENTHLATTMPIAG